MLEARTLSCMRGDRLLFAGVSFSVRPREALRVAGSNGAGKTSLLRLVCGLAQPESGEILWQGESIRSLREEFSVNLVYLGHSAALKDELTACENLMVTATLGGHPVTESDARAALGRLGLRGREDLPTRALSQGQRRRVNLARLVLPRAPKLWILDEPFTALDAKAVKFLTGVIDVHLAAEGMVVYTTHQEVSFAAGQHDQLHLDRARQTAC